MSRSRSTSESSDNLDHLGLGGMCEVGEVKRGVSYDMDGKFSYSQVVKCGLIQKFKTTVDENGKFQYYSSDMRPVPPGWYDLDKSKHKVPVGWYQTRFLSAFLPEFPSVIENADLVHLGVRVTFVRRMTLTMS